MNPISAARIAGETSLGIGTITGGAYAAGYANELNATKNDAVESLQAGYSLNYYLGIDHRNTINNVRGGDDEGKTLMERIDMHRGCISEYLKGHRSWTQEEKLIYEETKKNNNTTTTASKTIEKVSCKKILDNIKAILGEKYSDSKYK